MKNAIRIKSADGITLEQQLQIVLDYIAQESDGGEPVQSKQGLGKK